MPKLDTPPDDLKLKALTDVIGAIGQLKPADRGDVVNAAAKFFGMKVHVENGEMR